eukprot:PITA_12678
MVEDGKFRVEKFNGHNFPLWKMQMEDYLYQKDLYLPLSGKTKKLMAMTDEEWIILDKKALKTMSEGGPVADRLNDFNIVTSQLSSVGVNFDDEVRALLFLCSLLESWNGLVMAISNSISRFSTLKFDDVVDAILSEEIRRKSFGETSGNALNAESRGRKMERGKSSGYRSKSRKGRSKSRSGIL